MVITLNSIEELRSKLVAAQKETDGKKVWVYIDIMLVLGLHMYSTPQTEDVSIMTLPETEKDAEALFTVVQLGDYMDYCHAITIESRDINFGQFKGEPEELIFVKPTAELTRQISYEISDLQKKAGRQP